MTFFEFTGLAPSVSFLQTDVIQFYTIIAKVLFLSNSYLGIFIFQVERAFCFFCAENGLKI